MIFRVLKRDKRETWAERARRWHRRRVWFPRVIELEGRGRALVWLTSLYVRRSASLRKRLYLVPGDPWPERETDAWATVQPRKRQR